MYHSLSVTKNWEGKFKITIRDLKSNPAYDNYHIMVRVKLSFKNFTLTLYIKVQRLVT